MCHISSHLWAFANVISCLKYQLTLHHKNQLRLLFSMRLSLNSLLQTEFITTLLMLPQHPTYYFFVTLLCDIFLICLPICLCTVPTCLPICLCTVSCGGITEWDPHLGVLKAISVSLEKLLGNTSRESARNLEYNKKTEFYLRKVISCLEMRSRCILHLWRNIKTKSVSNAFLRLR